MSIRLGKSSKQKLCCSRSAQHRDAGYCNDCGDALLRCAAFEECGSLLDASGMCPVCIDVSLSLDAGAATSVSEGGKLALPLRIKNASSMSRPLIITSLWIKEEDGALRDISLPFERLEPGASANVAIRTGKLDYAGVHQVDLLIGVASRYEWREEQYVFSSSIIFPVESADVSGPVTNVNVTADQVGAGFTVYNPTRIESDRKAGRDTALTAIPLQIVRADRVERDLHKRGYDDGLIVPRKVIFEWKGFTESDAPYEGPILRPSGMFFCGRNSTDAPEGPNDVRIRVGNEPQQDKLNLSISRHHFTLYIESGRLMVRVDSQFGIRLNDLSLERTKTAELRDGDTIYPLRKNCGAIALKVKFETNKERVTRIIIHRQVRA